MYVSVEISYYPLTPDFTTPIQSFIDKIKDEKVQIETGPMSTVISGEYALVMSHLTDAMGKLMEEYPSVFTLKISNSCIVTNS